MKIPDSIKIGGKTYTIEQTRNLSMGNQNYSGEIDYMELTIKIVPGSKQRMEADFLHELVHGIQNHLGYVNHNEKEIDELANALHMVIVDNPDIFERGEN